MNEEMNEKTIEQVDAATTEEQAEAQSKEKPVQEKKYTDEDVDRIIARKIAAERKRMSKLFNEEQQESELEKRERNVLMRELKADAKDALIGEGLPSSLASLLCYDSKEEYEKSYGEVTSIFRAAIHQGVKDVLKGPVPTKGYSVSESTETAIKNAFAPKAR